MSAARTTRELLITTWAVAGVGLLFLEAIARIGVRTLRLLREGMDAWAWVALVLVVALFSYGEGYYALQRRFVPHVLARAVAFGTTASGCLTVISAPLHAMSLLGARRREVVRAWLGVALIALAIVVVRALPAPWRAIVDAGVTAALAWGLVALAIGFSRLFSGARQRSSKATERV
jgi:hypothetical protein